MSERRSVASVVLMAVGALSMGPVSDIVDSETLGLGLAIGGGAVFLVAGLWWLQLLDDRDTTDERFLQIGFRASTLSFWTLLVGLMTVGSVESGADVTYPVFSHYTWLLLAGLAVFVTAWSWYSRRM
ncbi:hypothetical protein [Haloterrigena salifodinae]|uniref:DUF2178 domain-containing protein n=1 Tax=Haloterrigena salifodinae TaxID=2675099 RepID=A0A8T8E3H7_9EURY|nr:hypothetical protein [Haloterrigena salifodinae]QRV16137.1 hypothetical protein JMJ58_04360 [Haloterrigena salifodinae]